MAPSSDLEISFSTWGGSRLYPPYYLSKCNVAFPCTEKYIVFHALKEARGVVTVCIVRDHLNVCYHPTGFGSVMSHRSVLVLKFKVSIKRPVLSLLFKF